MVDLKRDKLTHGQKAQAALMSAVKYCKLAQREAATEGEHAEWSMLVEMIEQTAVRALGASAPPGGKQRATDAPGYNRYAVIADNIEKRRAAEAEPPWSGKSR